MLDSGTDLLESLRAGLQEEPGYQYGSVLPFRAPQGDSSGQGLELALPGMIRSPALGMLDLLQGRTETYGGKTSLGADATNAMLLPAMRGLGSQAQGSTLLTFIGPKGAQRLADMGYTQARESMAVAERMEQAGATRGDIYSQTGWHKTADGQWNFEVPDNVLALKEPGIKVNPYSDQKDPSMTVERFNPAASGDPHSLWSGLSHPILEKAYPELASTELRGVPIGDMFNLKGGYIAPEEGKPGRLYLGGMKPQEMREVATHELQHAVDTAEGRQAGGRANQFLPMEHQSASEAIEGHLKRMKEMTAQLGLDPTIADFAARGYFKGAPDVDKATKVLSDSGLMGHYRQLLSRKAALDKVKDRAFQTYWNLLGETKARTAANRMDWTPEQRMQNPPFGPKEQGGWDVPEKQQLVTPPGPVQMVPVDHDPFDKGSAFYKAPRRDEEPGWVPHAELSNGHSIWHAPEQEPVLGKNLNYVLRSPANIHNSFMGSDLLYGTSVQDLLKRGFYPEDKVSVSRYRWGR